MRVPLQQVRDLVEDIVYKEYCARHNHIFQKNKQFYDTFNDNVLDEWIVNNCHAWRDSVRKEWIFWSNADYLIFLLKYRK